VSSLEAFRNIRQCPIWKSSIVISPALLFQVPTGRRSCVSHVNTRCPRHENIFLLRSCTCIFFIIFDQWILTFLFSPEPRECWIPYPSFVLDYGKPADLPKRTKHNRCTVPYDKSQSTKKGGSNARRPSMVACFVMRFFSNTQVPYCIIIARRCCTTWIIFLYFWIWSQQGEM